MSGDIRSPKMIVRILFGCTLIAAFCCYLLEFIDDQEGYSFLNLIHIYSSHHNHAGYIILFVFILIWLIIGAVAVALENTIAAVIFVAGMIILVTVDGIYVGWIGAIITGSLAIVFGAVYAFAMNFAALVQRIMLSAQLVEAGLNELMSDASLKTNESNSDEDLCLPGAILPSVCLIIMLILLIICVNCSSQPAKTEDASSPPFQEPQVKSNIILCDSEMVKFEYLMVIRIGSSTEMFPKNTWMDIAIIGKDGSVLGKTTRYKCELFETCGINELHLTIGYIASLPLIKGLLVSHNLHNDSQLLLYDYTLIDLCTLQNTVIEERLFMKKITKKPTLFKGRPAPFSKDLAQQLKEKTQAKEWTSAEKSLIISLVTLSVACSVIVFEQTSAYFSFSDEDGSLYRSLFDILYVSVIGSCLLVLVLVVYKYFLRQKVAKFTYFDCCSLAFLSFYMVISFALAGILLSLGTLISFPKSLFWFGSTLNICIIVFGFWCFYSSYSEFCIQNSLNKSMLFGEEDTESFLAQFEPDTKGRHVDRKVFTEKTTFYDGKTMVNSEKQTVATNSSVGPKLINIKPKKAVVVQKVAFSIAKCKEVLVQKTIHDKSNCISKLKDKKILSASLSKDINGNLTTSNNKGKVKANKT